MPLRGRVDTQRNHWRITASATHTQHSTANIPLDIRISYSSNRPALPYTRRLYPPNPLPHNIIHSSPPNLLPRNIIHTNSTPLFPLPTTKEPSPASSPPTTRASPTNQRPAEGPVPTADRPLFDAPSPTSSASLTHTATSDASSPHIARRPPRPHAPPATTPRRVSPGLRTRTWHDLILCAQTSQPAVGYP